ncbi:hypothetical protein PPL_09120 [Heterostelium album PN500]|uniref:Uncharacterized protein n=1 Tax=Heterostelium pallidum (strain ATCC 26659 / Pp 5 / PN500) TaxID=670386 RepID=D3BKN8_HETP5|nr:hypothetical protein PPL_09120 [Heterostelium album PN500]EFA78468.1 hypothetical protein PPL_09120 [Heterostelium album PN500]|eukprot:XP_020430592.1 hypothetical protein PPL_09120 [Heterostelium album PN500]
MRETVNKQCKINLNENAGLYIQHGMMVGIQSIVTYLTPEILKDTRDRVKALISADYDNIWKRGVDIVIFNLSIYIYLNHDEIEDRHHNQGEDIYTTDINNINNYYTTKKKDAILKSIPKKESYHLPLISNHQKQDTERYHLDQTINIIILTNLVIDNNINYKINNQSTFNTDNYDNLKQSISHLLNTINTHINTNDNIKFIVSLYNSNNATQYHSNTLAGKYKLKSIKYMETNTINDIDDIVPEDINNPMAIPSTIKREKTLMLSNILSIVSKEKSEYVMFMEDDVRMCPNSLSTLSYLIKKSTIYLPSFKFIRTSFGVNGLLFKRTELASLSTYLRQNFYLKPVEILFAEYMCGMREYGLDRTGICNMNNHQSLTFRWNLLEKQQTNSYNNNNNNNHGLQQDKQPICWTDYGQKITDFEEFNVTDCSYDDLSPCIKHTGGDRDIAIAVNYNEFYLTHYFASVDDNSTLLPKNQTSSNRLVSRKYTVSFIVRTDIGNAHRVELLEQVHLNSSTTSNSTKPEKTPVGTYLFLTLILISILIFSYFYSIFIFFAIIYIIIMMNQVPQQQQQQPIQQTLTEEQIWEVFDQAVKRVFLQWTALQLAVQNAWGGRSSEEKAEDIRQDILDLFLMGKPVYPDMIMSILEDRLSNELNTIAEDDSYREVSEIIIQIFNFCCKGMFNEVVQLVGTEMNTAISQCINPSGMDDDSSDDDTDAGDASGDMEMEDDTMVEEEQPKPKKNEPDEDGWITVGRKGRR